MAGDGDATTPPGPPFLDRIRADLAESRRRRLADLAVERGFVAREQVDELLRRAAPGRPLEEALVAHGGLRPSQVEDLVQAVDGEVSPGRVPSMPRYETGEKLGEGAVSVVYRGLDRQLGRAVALKVVRESLAAQPKVRERLFREAQSLARMDHPHVVKVHDVVHQGEQVVLVMEL
ncbi:MAG TPA: protein kinase, partial [Planctomycetota bacterium]|nr:protein kinase [Planctomycetota bacterium]